MDALTHSCQDNLVSLEAPARRRVLLLHADKGIRTSLQKLLEDVGYAIGTASNNQDLTFGFEPVKPDLLLLDLDVAPAVLRGVFDWLRSRHPSLPVIGMTTMPEKLKPALVTAFRPLLELPVEVPALLGRIESVFAAGDTPARGFQQAAMLDRSLV